MTALLGALLCMIGLAAMGTGLVEAYSMATYLLIWFYAVTIGFGLALAGLFLLGIVAGGTLVGSLVRHPIIGFALGTVVNGLSLPAFIGGIVRGALLIGGAWLLHAAADVPGITSLIELDSYKLSLGLTMILIGIIWKKRIKNVSED